MVPTEIATWVILWYILVYAAVTQKLYYILMLKRTEFRVIYSYNPEKHSFFLYLID